MTRISRDEMLMAIADVVARRSTCNRLHVGAVISLNGRIISTGYAGAPSGLPHCGPDSCDLTRPCTRTTHAEQGAIAFAARHGVAINGATLYVTHCPCNECAKSIINAGISRVVYRTPYRLTEGIDLLRMAGIPVEHYI